jgi:hypothetical protein
MPHTKKFQNLNSEEHLFVITFAYVTFVALWSGPFYVLAVDYDRYWICKHRPFNSNESKYVICEYFKCVTKWNTRT